MSSVDSLITSQNVRHSQKGMITRSRRPTTFKSDWLKKTDSNGDKVEDYLRPVKNDPYRVFCVVDSTTLKISTRGWAQVQDHLMGETHTRCMKMKRSQQSIGVFSEHHLADRKAINNFNMRLLLFCNQHGVALENYDCLVKCVQECCPDSKIARTAKPLSRKSVCQIEVWSC